MAHTRFLRETQIRRKPWTTTSQRSIM